MDRNNETSLEIYIRTVQDSIASAVHTLVSSSPDLPHIRQIVNRLWDDITRFGPPSLPQIPGLGSFEVPHKHPLPAPPPPPTLSESVSRWVQQHKWLTVGAGVGLVGTSLLTGYGVVSYKRYVNTLKKQEARKRQEVVVLLGADHPLGLPLILALESQGYIIIATVSSPALIPALESRTCGYTRFIVLDPSSTDPNNIPTFLRSLQNTLSLRFPTTSPGDPYVPSSTPSSERSYIHSLISLLSLPNPSSSTPSTPFESLSLNQTYLPHLTSTHLTPLSIIQSLLPIFRRSPRSSGETTVRKSIIVCVPAQTARVGMPFSGAECMGVAATVRGVEVMRRELKMALEEGEVGGAGTKVVIVDVGSVAIPSRSPSRLVPPSPSNSIPSGHPDPELLTASWSASAKSAYARPLLTTLEASSTAHARTPAKTARFVNAIMGVVSGGTRGVAKGYGKEVSFGRVLRIMWGKVRVWWWGERFGIGAGATTYSLASYLPPRVLDFLLRIPQAIVSMTELLKKAHEQSVRAREGSHRDRERRSKPATPPGASGYRLIEDIPGRPAAPPPSSTHSRQPSVPSQSIPPSRASSIPSIPSSKAPSKASSVAPSSVPSSDHETSDIESLPESDFGSAAGFMTDSWVSLKEGRDVQGTGGGWVKAKAPASSSGPASDVAASSTGGAADVGASAVAPAETKEEVEAEEGWHADADGQGAGKDEWEDATALGVGSKGKGRE